MADDTYLTNDDLSGLPGSTQAFFNNIHQRIGGILPPQQDSSADDLSNMQTRQRNQFGGRMGVTAHGQNATNAVGMANSGTGADYAADVQARAAAIGAPYGSIAQRNSPDQYGSIASRQFKDTFHSGAIDDMNAAIGAADPDQRQGLQQRFRKAVGG